jgi:serine/threonine protein kinase
MSAGREAMAGREIAGYRLLHALGAGGAGEVYLSQRVDDPAALAAVKLLRPLSGADPAAAAATEARFRREAEAARRLDHPNILPVLAYGRDDNLDYMILPFMSGGALTARINAFTRGMPLSLAADYLNQIAAALDYAHERGVIHRDVKPANVLLDANGRLLLADFGIARVFETPGFSALATLTAEGQMLGTPAYMAPEQLDGPRVSHQADIYALGVTLYQMVTGALPFEADTPIALAMKRLQSEPAPPRRDRADLPAAAQAAILRALARRPEDRYPTAGALARAFDAAVRGQLASEEPFPTSASALPPGSSASTFAATPSPSASAIGAARGAGWTAEPAPRAAKSVAASWGHQNAPTQPDPLAHRHSRGAPALWMLLGVALALVAIVTGVIFSGAAPFGLGWSRGGFGLLGPTATAPATLTPVTGTPTLTVTATISAAAAACLALSGYSKATSPASAGTSFPDVPFPVNAVSFVYSTFSDGAYHFILLSACAPDASSASVRAFYAQAMPANGWIPSATFPYAGHPTRACGDSYCWKKGSSPQRFVSLERVTASGAQATFQLRLGLLP